MRRIDEIVFVCLQVTLKSKERMNRTFPFHFQHEDIEKKDRNSYIEFYSPIFAIEKFEIEKEDSMSSLPHIYFELKNFKVTIGYLIFYKFSL